MEINNKQVTKLADKYDTPLYVYDLNKISKKADNIQQAFHSDEIETNIYYAMKANPHPVILDLLNKKGFGVDSVSTGEVEVALNSGIKPENILYTGNYESKRELEFLAEKDVQINLDGVNALKKLLDIKKPERISFRINPGKGSGKYKHITTGGNKAKFGVPYQKATEAYKKAKDARIERFGAHTFIGSGILDEDHFPEVVELLLTHLRRIKQELGISFEFIDIGGGFGIPYFDDNNELDIFETGEKTLEKFKKLKNKFDMSIPELAIEPGRYIVGDGGYLITRVTSIKESYRKYIGIDAGFNTLIRPALYGAEHSIVVNGKENEQDTDKVDICGQICENTDILTRDRELPKIEEGDILVIKQAGAYGSIMSMPYNMRMRPAEVGIYDGEDILLTRKENLEDHYNRIEIDELP